MNQRSKDTLTALVLGGVLGVMLAAGCTETQKDAARRDLANFGKCTGVQMAPKVLGSLLGLLGNAPADRAEWGAWGTVLARDFGKVAVGCGAEVLAAMPEPAPALVAPAVAVQPSIGFHLPASGTSASSSGGALGMTAGPSGGSGAAMAGVVSSTSDPHAAARWLVEHPDAW